VKNILWLFSILLLFVSSARSETENVPADVVVALRHQAQMTYANTQVPHNQEYAAALLSDGSVVYAMVSDRGGKFSLPQGIMLLLHTHPYGAQPVPSDADKATAERIAAPNCVVTATKVWCAMPNRKVLRGELASRQTTSASLFGAMKFSAARTALFGPSDPTRSTKLGRALEGRETEH
jgi:hypothetical protein